MNSVVIMGKRERIAKNCNSIYVPICLEFESQKELTQTWTHCKSKLNQRFCNILTCVRLRLVAAASSTFALQEVWVLIALPPVQTIATADRLVETRNIDSGHGRIRKVISDRIFDIVAEDPNPTTFVQKGNRKMGVDWGHQILGMPTKGELTRSFSFGHPMRNVLKSCWRWTETSWDGDLAKSYMKLWLGEKNRKGVIFQMA